MSVCRTLHAGHSGDSATRHYSERRRARGGQRRLSCSQGRLPQRICRGPAARRQKRGSFPIRGVQLWVRLAARSHDAASNTTSYRRTMGRAGAGRGGALPSRDSTWLLTCRKLPGLQPRRTAPRGPQDAKGIITQDRRREDVIPLHARPPHTTLRRAGAAERHAVAAPVDAVSPFPLHVPRTDKLILTSCHRRSLCAVPRSPPVPSSQPQTPSVGGC